MSNIVRYRIAADVPFNWLNEMPDDDVACFASVALAPSVSGRITYGNSYHIPNPDGTNGVTAMYRMWLIGEEALSWRFLERLCKAILRLPGAKLHIAEAKDTQWPGEPTEWQHMVDESVLSGEALHERKTPRRAVRRTVRNT